MKHTSVSAVIVPFKIRLCIHIAMLQYHTTFAKIISQCVHRGNDHHPPTPLELLISNPRGDNKDNCNL